MLDTRCQSPDQQEGSCSGDKQNCSYCMITDGRSSGCSGMFFILMSSGNYATSGNPAIPGNLLSEHPVKLPFSRGGEIREGREGKTWGTDPFISSGTISLSFSL